MVSPIAWTASRAATPRGGSPSCATAASACSAPSGSSCSACSRSPRSPRSSRPVRLRVLVLAPVIGRVAPLLAGAWLAPATPGQGLGAAFAAGLSRWAGPAHVIVGRRAGRVAARDLGRGPRGGGVERGAARGRLRGAPPRRDDRGRAGRGRGGGGARRPCSARRRPRTGDGSERHHRVPGPPRQRGRARKRAGSSGISTCRSPRSGIAQVDALSRRLRGVAFDAIYCSDLERTRHSAEILAAPHALTPVRNAALREFAMGEWDGLTAEQIRARDARAFEAWMADVGRFQFPGGESLPDLVARAVPAFEALVAAARGRHGRGGGARREQSRDPLPRPRARPRAAARAGPGLRGALRARASPPGAGPCAGPEPLRAPAGDRPRARAAPLPRARRGGRGRRGGSAPGGGRRSGPSGAAC